MTDCFTLLSKLLSEAPLDIQIIINEVLKHKYMFRHVLHSMEEFISRANEKYKKFLIDRNELAAMPGEYYEIMPIRLGLKFTRHDHIPEMTREVWSRLFRDVDGRALRGLLHAPDRLVEIHDTSKYYIAGGRIKSYPYSGQVFGCEGPTMYGFGDREKDSFVGAFMSNGLTTEMSDDALPEVTLQDIRQAYNTVARSGQMEAEERLIRRMMDLEEIQINS